MSGWIATKLSDKVWKFVENDRFGQYPFTYLILGVDKCVVIDTGTGQHNLKQACDQINTQNLPYLVLITHIHFDHIGGARHFSQAPNCLGVYMAGSAQTFSANFEINSLALAHPGASVQDFHVTKFLNEGDIIHLDDKDKENKAQQVAVLFTPGHTPDSAAFWYPAARRLFIGDTLYPFTAVHLDCIGSNVKDYVGTLAKLVAFVKAKASEPLVVDTSKPTEVPVAAPAVSAPPAVVETPKPTPPSPYEAAIEQLVSILSLQRSEVSKKLSLESLLSLCDGSVEVAMDMYLTDGPEQIAAMCPPLSKPAASGSSGTGLQVSPAAALPSANPNEIYMSCGHVEENLTLSALEQMQALLSVVEAGALPPAHRDGDYGEYTYDNFTIMLPMQTKWR